MSEIMVPAARARLPLECVRQDASGEIHVTLDVLTALGNATQAVGVPARAVLGAAWSALVKRITAGEGVAEMELAPENGARSKLLVPLPETDEVPFSTHAERAAAVLSDAALRPTEGSDAQPSIARISVNPNGVELIADRSRFYDESIERIAASFKALIEHVAEAPATPIGELAIVGEAERKAILETFNATAAAFEGTCFHYLFEDQARATPHLPALAFSGEGHTGEILTYGELNERANRLASYLRKHGGEGRCIALLVERSAAMIVGLLGILKAGSAYVPLLPDVPQARLAHQLKETQAPVILTQEKLVSVIPASDDVRVVCLDRDWETIAQEPADAPPRTTSPEDYAYVIYTSGSTGNPKGVAVRHDNLVNYTRFLAGKLGLKVGGEAGGVAPMSFATVSTLAADLGNTSIFPCLASGGCLHVISGTMSLDGREFGDYADKSPIDVLKITPSHLAALMSFDRGERILPRKYLVTGGEASTWPLLAKVRQRPGLVWFNHYGPTETTIGSLTFDIDESIAAFASQWSPTVPIGRPIANTRCYVLDDRRQLAPIGVIGELYIGGRGVTAGYINQPEMTNERFISDPYSPEPQASNPRMYRTGDRVRMLPNGAIEFLGRVDHQVKIRGYRIELGEIESVLRKNPEVAQTIVVAREDRPGDLRIVAYVVSTPDTTGTADNRIARLRDALHATLPSFMVPAAFVVLDALPLTPNGKVDRKGLPVPTDGEPSEASAGEANGESNGGTLDGVEDKIATIWREVLGTKRVGVKDDFFRIGGDSLKALYVLARIERELGKRLTNIDFIQDPTVAGLAAVLRGERAVHDFASLVPLQTQGTKPPIFCIHGGGGHVYYYRDLAARLGTDQPFYGLQGRHADGKMPRQTRVEEMAEFYLEEMRHVQPKGPYYLAGASFGGKVAFEIAQILRRNGEEAALVAMFDTWGPGYPNFKVGKTLQAAGWLYRRLEHHLGSVVMLDPEQRAAYLRDKAEKTAVEIKDNVLLQLSRLQGRAGVKVGAPNVDEGFIAIASKAYRPTFYPGTVHLFRSKQQPLGIDNDEKLGWGGLAEQLVVHDVVGLHAAVVAEPRVKFLVEKLRPVLEAAQRKYSGVEPAKTTHTSLGI